MERRSLLQLQMIVDFNSTTLKIFHMIHHSKGYRFGSGWLLHNKCPPDASDLMVLYVAPQPFNKFVSANCQHNVAPLQSY